ncbi:MAG TPA: alpha-ketoglutarate-dependent dioxygenase AlkB [Caulobacteraceae bacterium]|jgi:alkylated DNA repair protein (DNA oxidative demethylase)
MTPAGFRLIPGRLNLTQQRALADEVLALAAAAPPYRPVTPGGKAMSVAMTNLGRLGWVTDARGYRYQPHHPLTGEPWPAIPAALTALWTELCDAGAQPDCCLVNLYDADARMGLHRDNDEADFSFPVLSVSLGDAALFRLGGLKRGDPTGQMRLASGDVCVLGGAARRAYHGIDRIIPGSSRLLPGGGRINLTLRRAAPA